MQLVAILIEIIGIAVVATGIGLEMAIGGSTYLVIITIGSLLVASGGIVWGKFIRGKK
jgi:hypothetical protein